MSVGVAAFSFQLEGGQSHPTGLQIEVTGTKGVLRIIDARGFQNVDDSQVLAMVDGADTFIELPIKSLPVSHLDASAREVA